MTGGNFLRLLIIGILITPVCLMLLLGFSPSIGMDFFTRPEQASLRWWQLLFNDAKWVEAFFVSVNVAVVSTFVAITITLPAVVAFRIIQAKVDSFILLAAGVSYFVPPVVLALSIYGLFDRLGFFDSVIGLSLAHLSVTIPLSVYILWQQIGPSELNEYVVARSLGADRATACVTWISAQHRLTILAAGAAAFMGSMSEATLTIFLTDTNVITLPRLVISSIGRNIDPTGFAAMAVWVSAIAVLVHLFGLVNSRQET